MTTCAVCSKSLGKRGFKLKCSICAEWYHKGCVVISEEEFGLVQTKKKNWCCANCSLDDDDEIVDEESDEDEEEIPQRGGKYLSKVSPTTKQTSKITLKSLMEKMDIVINQNIELIKKTSSIEKKYKDLKKEVDFLQRELNQLKVDSVKIKNDNTLKKQEELKNNIIISGLPTQNKETDELKEVLINIGKELQVTIKKRGY